MNKLSSLVLAGALILGSCDSSASKDLNGERVKTPKAHLLVKDEPKINYELANLWLRNSSGPHYVSPLEIKEYLDSRPIPNVIKSSIGLGYEGLSRDVLLDFALTNCHTMERVRDVYEEVNKRSPPYESSDLVRLAFDNSKSLINDSEFSVKVKSLFGEDINCKADSGVLTGNYLYLLRKNSIEGDVSLVTGLYFGNLAPQGNGHSWVVINDSVVDSSLRPNFVRDERHEGEVYVPIISTNFVLKGSNVNATIRSHYKPKEEAVDMEERK